jgi:hypothetical protein
MTLTAGTSSYTLPSAVLRIKEMYVTPVGGVQQPPLIQTTLDEILRKRQAGGGTAIATGSVTHYALLGLTEFEVYPTPRRRMSSRSTTSRCRPPCLRTPTRRSCRSRTRPSCSSTGRAPRRRTSSATRTSRNTGRSTRTGCAASAPISRAARGTGAADGCCRLRRVPAARPVNRPSLDGAKPQTSVKGRRVHAALRRHVERDRPGRAAHSDPRRRRLRRRRLPAARAGCRDQTRRHLVRRARADRGDLRGDLHLRGVPGRRAGRLDRRQRPPLQSHRRNHHRRIHISGQGSQASTGRSSGSAAARTW